MKLHNVRSTWWEEQARIASDRLGKDHEHHTMAKLPCCGSAVEITDPTKDTYVTCPNKLCGKRHMVVGDRNHKIVSEAPLVQRSTTLIF